MKLSEQQKELLIEILRYKKITALHILDQNLVNQLVAIILDYEEELDLINQNKL
jgi:hypothetical protein